MNNEEKILALLEAMDGRLDRLESGQEELRAEVSDIKADVAGIKLRLENEVTQKFNLLAEGQQIILERMATKESLEELKEEQRLLKQVVTLHSREIAELKKAE